MNIKSFAPHIAAVIVFLLVSIVFFSPILEGKKIQQSDIVHNKGMSKEVRDFRTETGEEALWTNSMFGGMPAYYISVVYSTNLLRYVDKLITIYLPHPIPLLFLYMLGFYFLLLVMRVNPWLAIAGGLAFAFSGYLIMIIEAGHNSKAHVIGYMAPVLASVILTYRGKLLLGGALFALFMGLNICFNHYQITYYLAMLLGIYWLYQLYISWKEKALPSFAKATGVLAMAMLLAIAANIGRIWSANEYVDHTIRGKSELSSKKEDRTEGLDKSYITQWSYGVDETINLLIPNFKGGASAPIGDNESALEGVDPQMKQVVAQMQGYFGSQPFVAGPYYLGAVVILLCILAFFLLKSSIRWPLLIAMVLAVMLAWGKNFQGITDLFLDYFPMYNKFRAPTTILVIVELLAPFLAIFVLHKIVSQPKILTENIKKLYWIVGVLAGFCLYVYMSPNAFGSFLPSSEMQRLTNQLLGANWPQPQISALFDNLEIARRNLVEADAIRSAVFILIAGVLLFLFAKKKLSKNLLIGSFAFLVMADMWPVAKRMLDKDDFVTKQKYSTPYTPNQADKQIMADDQLYFRVFNTLARLDQDSRTSYFHKSLGGYHAAKLRRYQEVIDYHLSGQPNISVINMLNTKYIITTDENKQPAARLNTGALGNAWFVEEYQLVENADEEIAALSGFSPERKTFVDKRYGNYLDGLNINKDAGGDIQLTSYAPNHLEYSYKASSEQLTVFSEIYYPEGWNAYIDGKEVEHIRVNYILRALRIPAGDHKIEFKFEPASYYTGRYVMLGSSLLIILLVAFSLFKERKQIAIESDESNEN